MGGKSSKQKAAEAAAAAAAEAAEKAAAAKRSEDIYREMLADSRETVTCRPTVTTTTESVSKWSPLYTAGTESPAEIKYMYRPIAHTVPSATKRTPTERVVINSGSSFSVNRSSSRLIETPFAEKSSTPVDRTLRKEFRTNHFDDEPKTRNRETFMTTVEARRPTTDIVWPTIPVSVHTHASSNTPTVKGPSEDVTENRQKCEATRKLNAKQRKAERWAKVNQRKKDNAQKAQLRRERKQQKQQPDFRSVDADGDNDTAEAEPKESFQPTRYAQLNAMLEKDAREVTFNLSDPLFGFKELLELDVAAMAARLAVVVELLAVVSECDECPQTKVCLLKTVLCSKFFSSTLPKYFIAARIGKLSAEETENVPDALDDVALILKEMLTCLPAMASTRITMLIQACYEISSSDAELRAEFRALQLKVNSTLQGHDKVSMMKHVDDEMLQAQMPPDDFRTMSITPTLMDAHNKKLTDFLRPNIVGRAYLSTDHYLDVHFRLMREDLVASLRQSVQMYLQRKNRGQLSKLKLHEAMAYFDVRMEDLHCNQMDGVTHVLAFNVQKLSGAGEEPVDWEDTKRLKPGCLVTLSTDDFESFFLATACQTIKDKLEKGRLNVKFLESEVTLDMNAVYVMVECPAYYQAYGPVMKALQAIGNGQLPFDRYFVHAETKVKPPKYLSQDTVYTFGKVFRKDGCSEPFRPLVASSWPTGEQIGLEASQYRALQLALTSELSLVQGPPGTGKTFLGLKIVETLLANRDCWTEDGQSPILIICYTNHALDQFLEGLLGFMGSGIVRVGGQCESKQLQNFRLGKLRSNGQKKCEVPGHVYVYQKLLRNEMYQLGRDIALQMQALKEIEYLALDESALADVMVANHRGQFDATANKSLRQWLDLGLALPSRNKTAQGKNKNVILNFSDGESTETKKILEMELKKDNCMDDISASKVLDVWTLAQRNRWRLFQTWIRSLRRLRMESVRALCQEYEEQYMRLKEAMAELDTIILGRAKVVGMTTSGAARNRHLLAIVKPKIVIVEEAAEVLEAHIIAALTQHCQHLIMIGDQQQLRPNPTTYELAKNFGLDVSLFERLIRNETRYERLVVQHRMRPTISRLLVPHFYPTLENHASVHNHPDVVGLADNVYFVTHNKLETTVANTTSRCNQHEADYLVALAEYLVKRGNYLPSQITVLATYKGQVQILTDMLDALIESGLKCSSIDAYQGDENDVVLVSLVRSNHQGNVGFLKTENRVCVALSRARHGLYCIGNFTLLQNSSKLWKAIVAKQKAVEGIGSALKLTCAVHPSIVFSSAATAQDLYKATQRHGCWMPCEFRLRCGHPCPINCHGWTSESPHDRVKCNYISCREPSDDKDSDDEMAQRIGNLPLWERSSKEAASNGLTRYCRPSTVDLISFD